MFYRCADIEDVASGVNKHCNAVCWYETWTYSRVQIVERQSLVISKSFVYV